MSVMTCAGRLATMSSTCVGGSRKHAGDQLSNVAEYSRTAASPRSRISAMTEVTVCFTSARSLATRAAGTASFR